MEAYLTDSQQQILRQRGVLSENEVAKSTGDLLIAENAITGERRVLDKSIFSYLTETSKILLRG